MNIQDITLDLSKEYVDSNVVRIGMGDVSGTTIRATILDNSTIPSLDGMSATFYMQLPDGKHYVRDANCSVSGSVITYLVDEEHCCSVAGYTDNAYFEVSNGTEEYSTSRFRVKVERAAYEDAAPAESWDTAIDALIARGNAKMAEYEEAEQNRNNAIITGADATIDTTAGTPSVNITLDTPSALGRIMHFAFNHIAGGADEAITNAQIDTIANDGSVSSTNVLKATGLTYLWGKIKAKFASLVDGVVPVTQGGTGKGSHTANAVITGNGTNAVNNVASANGALYATSTNGAPQFGTLPVAQGGTGKVTHTSNALLTGDGTSAVKNVTTANGALYATSANGAAQFGTLPVAQGGTGATSHDMNSVVTGNGENAVKHVSTANGALYATVADGEAQFGTLPIAQGGTGITSNPSMLTNLGSTTADNVLKASPRPGITGTLGVAHGGTGKTTHMSNAVLTGNGTSAVNNVSTASGALYATAANGVAQFGTLPIAQGGTAGTTKAEARTSLEVPVNSSIAYVESVTAKTNHAVGDYFMLGDTLMKATSAIATGETISESNAVPATVQAQIDTLRDSVSRYDDLRSHLTSIKSGVTLQFWRTGKVAYIKAEGETVALNGESWNVLANISGAAYRPKAHIYGIGYTEYDGVREICETSVTSGGDVRIYSKRAGNLPLRLSLVFPIA